MIWTVAATSENMSERQLSRASRGQDHSAFRNIGRKQARYNFQRSSLGVTRLGRRNGLETKQKSAFCVTAQLFCAGRC